MATVIHTEDLAVSFDGTTIVFEGLNVAVEKAPYPILAHCGAHRFHRRHWG